MDNKSKILNMFSNLIEGDTGENGDIDTIVENGESDTNVISNQPVNTPQTNSNKKKSNKKSKRTHVNPDTDEPQTLRFSITAQEIINNTVLVEANIDGVKLDTPNSWTELLLFLIGAVGEYCNSKDLKFQDIASSSGIFDQNILFYKNNRVFLDKEFENGMEVYEVPNLEYKIAIQPSCISIHNSIANALKLLDIKQSNLSLNLIDKTQYNKPPEYIRVENGISLSELIVQIPVNFNPTSLIIDDYKEEASDIRTLVLYGIIYAIASANNPEIIYNALKGYTKKDIVGVCVGENEYFGSALRATQIPSTELYFYYNGMIKPIIEYLYNIYKTAGINTDNVIFTYYTFEVE